MKLKLLFFSLLICSAARAQNFVMKEKLADKYYNQYSYYKAIPMYEQLLKSFPKNYRIIEKLADSYRKENDSENAERCYSILVDTVPSRHEYLLFYAQALARNGKYEKAGIWYEKYSEAEPGDRRGKEFSALYKNMNSLFEDSSSYKIVKVPFNSETSDFSPAYFGNDLVYVSARKKPSILRSIYNRTYSSFLDIFIVTPDSKIVKPFSNDINSKYHEGPVTFTKNLDTVIFTRSNYYDRRLRKSIDGINKLKLFRAVWNKNSKRWTDIVPLPFNNDQYSVGHPALTTDGKTLFFASDMPGGMGGTDIYLSHQKTDIHGNTSWSEPQNLGPVINSPGDEMFPFMDKEGNLWFASDGVPGLGGLDIFEARKAQFGFLKPENKGFPLNTRFDDFGYITNNNGNDGYISSDRNNKIGDDDIFRITKISGSLPIIVYDAKTKLRIAAATIKVSTKNEGETAQVSNVSGLGKLRVKPGVIYSFAVTKEMYNDKRFELTPDKLEEMDTITISMDPLVPKFMFTGKVHSADNYKPVPNATAYLINKDGSAAKEVNSDETGTFRFELMPESEYTIKVTVTSKGSKCSSNSSDCTTRGLKIDMNFTQSFPVFCVGDVIKVENIYYDLGKYNIRPDAAVELDKLLEIMRTYPDMKIELRSHTDSRGTPSSNMILSEKRATAAAEYLFSKGITRNRIASKGFGDTMPLNNCIKGVKCTEDEYKVNRRTEFKILSIE
jgi:outer membrane protein OmpA-like peptidoglycan-associated protein